MISWRLGAEARFVCWCSLLFSTLGLLRLGLASLRIRGFGTTFVFSKETSDSWVEVGDKAASGYITRKWVGTAGYLQVTGHPFSPSLVGTLAGYCEIGLTWVGFGDNVEGHFSGVASYTRQN